MMTRGKRAWNNGWWMPALLALALASACDNADDNDERAASEAPDPSDPIAVIEGARAKTFANTSPAPLLPRGAAPDESGPPRQDPIVHVEPFDLSTDIGESELQVVVNNYGDPVADDLMNSLANRAHLRTWPEGQEVRTENEITFDSLSPNGDGSHTRRARVYLRPTAELEDRWYTITVDDLPSGLRWASRAPLHDFGSGRTGVRLRTGSDPVVRWVQVAEKEETGDHVVVVETSERIRLADGRSNGPTIPAVAWGGLSTACEMTAGRREQLSSVRGTLGLDVRCGGALSMDELLTVTVEAGSVMSLSGLPLRDPGGGEMTYSFVPTEQLQMDSGTWRLRL